MSEFATTGDGVLTGLHLVAEMARTNKSLAELAAVMTVYPQVLINVRDVDKDRCADDEGVQDAVAAAEAELGETGRVLLRKSGHRAARARDGRGTGCRIGAVVRREARRCRQGAPGALSVELRSLVFPVRTRACSSLSLPVPVVPCAALPWNERRRERPQRWTEGALAPTAIRGSCTFAYGVSICHNRDNG